MSTKTLVAPARKQSVFRQLEADLTAREIAKALVVSANPRAHRVLDMMLDSAYSHLSFGQLCSRAGVSAAEVLRLFFQQQIVEGMIRMARHLPQIMEDTALAAMGRTEACGECVATWRTGGSPCPHCSGTGEIRMPGDLRATRLVLQAMGILGPR